MRLVFLLLIASAAVAAENTCSATGTIVDQITRQPVPRAKLIVQAPRVARSSQADNSGNWSFADLPCARVAISASRFGYLDSRQARAIPQTVQLEPGSATRIEIELMPQAVISGKVSDQNGDPVMGVRVVPYIARAEEGRRVMRPAPQTVTDDRGEFRVPQLEPGHYIVCAEPAIGRQEYRDECYPADLASGARSAMPVRPGLETNVDFSLSAVQHVRLSGTVSGAPEGMRVNVQLARRPAAMFEPRMGAAAAPDGTFTLPSVAPGSYLLIATSGRNGEQYSARMPIEAGAADVENLSLALMPDVNVEGTVAMDSRQQDSSVLPDVNIALLPSEPDARPGQVDWGDDRRSFTLVGVSPGNYRLRVTGTNFYVKTATMGGRDITGGEFAIGQTSGPVRIVLGDDAGSLEGDVTAGDSPAAGWIVLMRDGAPFRTFPVESGHFTARNLPPGDYTVYAWDDLKNVEYAEPEWMRQNAGSGVPITITAGQTAPIKVPRQTAPSDY